MRVSFAVGSRVLSLPKLVRGLIKMSELNAKPRARGASLFWPAYMLSWAVLAGGALSYLSLNALHPSFQGGVLGTPPQSNQESNRAEIDRAQLTAQVRSLNETVASLRSDLDKFKQQQQERIAQATSEAETAQKTPTASNITTSSVQKSDPPRLAMTETGETIEATQAPAPASNPAATTAAASAPAQESGPVEPKIVNAPPAAKPAATAQAPSEEADKPDKPRRRRNLATSPLRPGSVPPLPPLNAQAPNQQSGAAADDNPFRAALLNETNRQIKTASIPDRRPAQPQSTADSRVAAASPTTFGAPTVTQHRAGAPAALSLSTAQSVTGLRASWLLLTSRHPGTFNRLQPRYLADQANGTYRLLAGPILSHAEADRICTELRAQSVSCGVTTYVGSALQ